MGSWNGTCGVSRLPICYGDDVVAFLIVAEPSKGLVNNYCYITGFAAPITFPIFAGYNDYGGIESVENEWVLEVLRKQFGLDEDQCVVSWINDEVYRDNVETKRGSPVGLWMMHRKIYDAMRGNWKQDGEKGTDSYALTIEADAHLFLDWLGKQSREFIELECNRIPYRKSQLPMLLLTRKLRDPRNESIGKVNEYYNYFMFEGGFNSSYHGGNPFASLFLDAYSHLFLEAFLDDKEDFIEDYIQHVIGMACLNRGMDSLRVGWGPQTGAGSQSGSYSSYESLNKAMQEVIEDARVDEEGDW